MDQVDALQRARLRWPQGLPLIRPHVLAPVLVRRGGAVDYVAARFGFSRKFSSFNARADRLASSPFWKSLFGRSHGVVALSYVVEWVEDAAGKQPYLIGRADGKLMMVPALVGAYQEKEGESAFALCTTEPNRFFARFHDRMAAQCTPDLVDRWLRPEERPTNELLECVRAPPDEELVAVPADRDIQKRKTGDWSALKATGDALTWPDLEASRLPERGAGG